MYNLIRKLSLPILNTLNNDYTPIIPQVERKQFALVLCITTAQFLLKPQCTDNPQNICERCTYINVAFMLLMQAVTCRTVKLYTQLLRNMQCVCVCAHVLLLLLLLCASLMPAFQTQLNCFFFFSSISTS